MKGEGEIILSVVLHSLERAVLTVVCPVSKHRNTYAHFSRNLAASHIFGIRSTHIRFQLSFVIIHVMSMVIFKQKPSVRYVV